MWHLVPWLESDPEEPIDGEVTLAVRVNGKARVQFRVPVGVARDGALALATGADNVRRYLGGSEFRRVVDRLPDLLNLGCVSRVKFSPRPSTGILRVRSRKIFAAFETHPLHPPPCPPSKIPNFSVLDKGFVFAGGGKNCKTAGRGHSLC